MFGAIVAQGIAIMIEKKVDMFSSKDIAVIASIMVLGVGGQYAFVDNIPFFGINIPCVAGTDIFGILLNAILSISEKRKHNIRKILLANCLRDFFVKKYNVI